MQQRKKLNPDQERALLYIAQTFSINNRSLCISEMCELVKKAWNIDVSAMTIRRWVKENRRNMSFRTCKALSDKRASNEVFQNVKNFGKVYDEASLPKMCNHQL